MIILASKSTCAAASKRVKVGTDEDTAREDVAMDSSPTSGNAATEENAVEEEDTAMEGAFTSTSDLFGSQDGRVMHRADLVPLLLQMLPRRRTTCSRASRFSS